MLNPRIFLIVLCVLGAALLLPIAGEDSGLSPIPATWAGFSCNADGDLYDRIHRKCPGGDDPDDSDPCAVPQGETPEERFNCDSGGGGGDGGLGSAIPLDCFLQSSWGDASTDTIKDDKLGPYQDAVDKVGCEVGGPSIPWPVRLAVGNANGPWAKIRQVDIALGEFSMGGFDSVTADWLGDVHEWLEPLYPGIFQTAEPDPENAVFPDMDDMDTLGLQVRPYRKTQTTESIHLLPADEVYEMGMNFSIQKMGIDRFRISVAKEWYEGNESFTGIACETGHEQEILDNTPGGAMQDVLIYLWPDSDADGLPDAYTVTTGTFDTDANDDVIFENGEPKLATFGPRYAAVCSAVGPKVCGNPQAPSNCNFLGYVPVTFTMTAKMK